jgi:hypothetical protein|tara:strand:+ start:297 stop:551 length:255 start_codon:yes stop_codon:yes gene_type:complete
MSDVEIHSLNGTTDHDDDAKVIGMVTNNTDDNLDFEVEVTFHRNGKFIGHGSDYIEVPRGRTRPFEVTEYNCPMTNFEVDLFVR